MRDNRISHDFFSLRLFCLDFDWIPAWEGGGSSRFIESHGFDLVLEGILVSHSLWYAKLTSGFWKENLYTHCLLLDVSSSPNQHQCCLQANSFVSFGNVQWYTVSINSASSRQPLKSLSCFVFFLVFLFFLLFLAEVSFQMDTGKIRDM